MDGRQAHLRNFAGDNGQILKEMSQIVKVKAYKKLKLS